ncbi:hypothetical protein F444_12689 [Phytophthora nicotianae P1976]|uniref:Uncharacterized protein n=1 Tax=Phytophthora nicotianae P1976 TaxID=1317066 RepID=A0A080ZWD6_PHYNI|nr:hypothetical protein F444_12689 [Phytophthora nicotianae P1976]
MDAHAYYEASHHIHFLARNFQTTTTFNTYRFPFQSASNGHFTRTHKYVPSSEIASSNLGAGSTDCHPKVPSILSNMVDAREESGVVYQTTLQKRCFELWGDSLVMDWTHGSNYLGYPLGKTHRYVVQYRSTVLLSALFDI